MGVSSFNLDDSSTYLDENLYKMNFLPLQWFKRPESLSRYNFLEIEELRFWPSVENISQFEKAVKATSLQYMIAGALKTLRTNPNPRVIIVDIPTPAILPEVKLYVSEKGNWHFNLSEPFLAERFEEINKLGYVYFQNNYYFIAMRPSVDKKDIFLFVYMK